MKNILHFVIFFLAALGYSQQANDCSDAIVVCGNTNISSNASGFGVQELDNTANPCLYEETNSLWLSVNIATAGTLAFIVRPDNVALEVDYDLFVFGPNSNCQNFNDPIRCSTTNPIQAGLSDNLTGLRDAETDQNEGPGELGNSFVSSISASAGEQYYILVDRPIGNGGFSIEWTGTAGFLPAPEVNQPNNIEVCSTTANTNIDLTVEENSFTTSTTALIQYFNSYEDAFDTVNQIPDPTQFLYPGNTTPIFVRVSNPNGCFDIINFNVMEIQFDAVPNLSYSLCDVDRNTTELFNLTEINLDIENSISNNSRFDFSLHPDETSANANVNQLNGNDLNTVSTQIYARISSTVVADCAITYPITLTVIDDPYPPVVNLVQCDIDEANSIDGITRFDLNQTFSGLSGVTINYYESSALRDAEIPINNPNDYTNTTPFNQTIYYRITSNQCESIGEVELEINPTLISINPDSPFIKCDDDSSDNDVLSTFNIEQIRQDFYSGVDVAFYSNLVDVALEQNPISGNYRTGTSSIYVRLESNNECQGVEELNFIVNPLPEISLDDTYLLCTDGDPIEIIAPEGFDEYSWVNSNSEVISTSRAAEIDEIGNYQLTVGISYASNGQSITCESTADFTVTPSNRASINDIIIDSNSGINTIEVLATGDGDYEYSIDAVNFQDEPRFENLDSGTYTVSVRDKNNCGITTENISVIGFPKYFTPNGDGINDTWQIAGANVNFGERFIYIFNRYGKLVRQLSTNEKGWDGMFKGTRLPASDYWFRITLENGELIKGHFSLKR